MWPIDSHWSSEVPFLRLSLSWGGLSAVLCVTGVVGRVAGLQESPGRAVPLKLSRLGENIRKAEGFVRRK